MGSSPNSNATGAPVSDRFVSDGVDAPRAFAFQLLGRLMLGVPDAALLNALQSLSTGAAASHTSGPFAAHWQAMGAAATAADPVVVEQEYTDLFIGLGRGQIIPYGSWYITGFLMDRPLAALREDLVRLGFTRDESASEPEDHVGAICEVLAMLIEDGAAGTMGNTEKQFFEAHLAPWAKAFFRDLAEAPAADFYQPVARFGEALVDFEADYLKMLA